MPGDKGSRTVRMGDLFRPVNGCRLDERNGDTGLLKKMVRLERGDNVVGEATREPCFEGAGPTRLSVRGPWGKGCEVICETEECEFNYRHPEK